jgi:hypothetical protein
MTVVQIAAFFQRRAPSSAGKICWDDGQPSTECAVWRPVPTNGHSSPRSGKPCLVDAGVYLFGVLLVNRLSERAGEKRKEKT